MNKWDQPQSSPLMPFIKKNHHLAGLRFFLKRVGLGGNPKEAGGPQSHGVNPHVSCQFLSLSSQRPQAAINSPAALPLQQGNELGNSKSHKGGGRQRLSSLFSAHPVRAPGMPQDTAENGELHAFTSNWKHTYQKGPTSPQFTLVPSSAQKGAKEQE